jgi:hypothetical protein
MLSPLGYRGFFMWNNSVLDIREFDPARMQDRTQLEADGRPSRHPYVANFIFVPASKAFGRP